LGVPALADLSPKLFSLALLGWREIYPTILGELSLLLGESYPA
jgi:hypothetical protein